MTGICLLLLCLGADPYTDFFARGNAAYASGDMAAAASAYGQLVSSGVENPEVFHNLGNAYYHLGDLGGAVLNLERAVGLDRDFEAAQRNLALAVSQTANRRARPAGFALEGHGPSWLPGVSRYGLRCGAVAIWWLMWGILATRAWKRQTAHFRTTLLLWGGLAVCAVVLVFPGTQPRAAVVMASDVPIRFGPDTRDTVRVLLAPGDRVVVDQILAAWARVELADGTRGWVERSALVCVGPPLNIVLTERDQSTP